MLFLPVASDLFLQIKQSMISVPLEGLRNKLECVLSLLTSIVPDTSCVCPDHNL